MPKAFLSMLLSALLLLSSSPCPQNVPTPSEASAPGEIRLWWGLIDPELSTWFARLPMETDSADASILWDWSWCGFLAALFSQPMAKEAGPDAVSA